MSEVIVHKGPPMPAVEARGIIDRIRSHMDGARELILELFERRGWASLGYADWKDFCAAEFGVSCDRLTRVLTDARLEREVRPGKPLGVVPSDTLDRLRELPAGQRKAAYESAEASEGGRVPTASRIAEIVAKARASVNPSLLAQTVRDEEAGNIAIGRDAALKARTDNRAYRIDKALWHLNRAASLLSGLGGEGEDAVTRVREVRTWIRKEMKEMELPCG